MKKLILATVLFIGLTSFAQVQRKDRATRDQLEKLTPDQRNTLELKKLTLELDLSPAQQKEMGNFIADQNAKREVKKLEREKMQKQNVKPTADQRFEMSNKRLDEQIANKERVKKILNPEQFKKWETLREKRGKMARNRMHHKTRTVIKTKE